MSNDFTADRMKLHNFGRYVRDDMPEYLDEFIRGIEDLAEDIKEEGEGKGIDSAVRELLMIKEDAKKARNVLEEYINVFDEMQGDLSLLADKAGKIWDNSSGENRVVANFSYLQEVQMYMEEMHQYTKLQQENAEMAVRELDFEYAYNNYDSLAEAEHQTRAEFKRLAKSYDEKRWRVSHELNNLTEYISDVKEFERKYEEKFEKVIKEACDKGDLPKWIDNADISGFLDSLEEIKITATYNMLINDPNKIRELLSKEPYEITHGEYMALAMVYLDGSREVKEAIANACLSYVDGRENVLDRNAYLKMNKIYTMMQGMLYLEYANVIDKADRGEATKEDWDSFEELTKTFGEITALNDLFREYGIKQIKGEFYPDAAVYYSDVSISIGDWISDGYYYDGDAEYKKISIMINGKDITRTIRSIPDSSQNIDYVGEITKDKVKTLAGIDADTNKSLTKKAAKLLFGEAVGSFGSDVMKNALKYASHADTVVGFINDMVESEKRRELGEEINRNIDDITKYSALKYTVVFIEDEDDSYYYGYISSETQKILEDKEIKCKELLEDEERVYEKAIGKRQQSES